MKFTNKLNYKNLLIIIIKKKEEWKSSSKDMALINSNGNFKKDIINLPTMVKKVQEVINMMIKWKWMKEFKMVIDIDKPVTMKSQETKELSTTKKKDIAQPVKTFTKIINIRILNILVKFKIDIKNSKIGNLESIEVKFKVR